MNNYKKLETRIKSLEQKKKKKEENIKKEQNEIEKVNNKLNIFFLNDSPTSNEVEEEYDNYES